MIVQCAPIQKGKSSPKSIGSTFFFRIRRAHFFFFSFTLLNCFCVPAKILLRAYLTAIWIGANF